jgi:hypothetical protein
MTDLLTDINLNYILNLSHVIFVTTLKMTIK